MLITLVIIGILAAITVPTLITKYQKEQTVTRLKKAYSVLSQATQKSISDNGPMSTWTNCVHTSGEDAVLFANKYIIPYLSISKNCELNNDDTCKFVYYSLDKTKGFSTSYYTRFYLTDGTLVALGPLVSGDIKYFGVFVDINGAKKPNILGKDIFLFHYNLNYPNLLVNEKFIPEGINMSRNDIINHSIEGCSKQITGNMAGMFCAALIMKDGWRIADDYPW